MSTETLTFTVVPAADADDPVLRQQLLDTWVRVTDAGGAVGFVAPAQPALIGEALDSALARIVRGQDTLGVLRRGEDQVAVAMGILSASASPLRNHWRTVLRLMVDPELQGRGAGGTLLEGLHTLARELGLEALCLSVRGGMGIERFYARHGYEVYGVNPRAIRVAADDERDEILMRHVL